MRLLAIVALLAAEAQAQAPFIEMEEEAPVAPGSGRRIPLGSYGEAFYEQSDRQAEEATLKRLIIFLGHQFDDRWRLYSEVEIEAEEGEGFKVEMEQAFVEYEHSEYLGVRAGLLLMPVGIINVLHESPTFHGNQRPLSDRVIVPTTWRELGAGVYGELVGELRFQAYLVRGLDASGFSDERPVRGGRLGGKEARADSAAGVFRLAWSPLGGLDLGASLYRGDASQGVDALGGVGVTMAEGDLRYFRSGFEARAQFAHISISGVDDIAAVRAGEADAPPAPADSTNGLYLELSYDVLRYLNTRHELMPFYRFERVDLGGDDPILVYQGGLTYRPHPQVAFKGDVSHIDPGDRTETKLALGVGFMF